MVILTQQHHVNKFLTNDQTTASNNNNKGGLKTLNYCHFYENRFRKTIICILLYKLRPNALCNVSS